ncbi:MAG: PQQ-binding-like beta-propeller repeat protein, partial [Saprospiraceae bacterium]|nr:PQQ-binding-like beta-propeller repeat protein [Saprospiraceae bacterium]
MRSIYTTLTLTFLLFFSCQNIPEKGSPEHIADVTGAIDDDYLRKASNDSEDWITYGQTYSEDRYSTLDQIKKDNLDQLDLAWAIELGVVRGFESTPIVVDGIMFITGPWSVVYAIDARKGEIIWQFNPEVDRSYAEKACCDVVNRGVALYKGDVFFGALDGRLISLDAASGTVNWEVMTVPTDRTYTITGAPRIVKGNVIIGNGGAEYDARGFVTAYNSQTGEQVWRFYTVPGNPAEEQPNADLAEAAKTWTGEWWKMGGGGTVWDAIVYDPELNLVYIGVGNGSPWDRNERSPE